MWGGKVLGGCVEGIGVRVGKGVSCVLGVEEEVEVWMGEGSGDWAETRGVSTHREALLVHLPCSRQVADRVLGESLLEVRHLSVERLLLVLTSHSRWEWRGGEGEDGS